MIYLLGLQFSNQIFRIGQNGKLERDDRVQTR